MKLLKVSIAAAAKADVMSLLNDFEKTVNNINKLQHLKVKNDTLRAVVLV